MKKLVALLLGLTLLCCSAAALAEESLPYLEARKLDGYINANLLPAESCPRVCISPFSSYTLFERRSVDPWYVSFPGPSGAGCVGFELDSCSYIDSEAGIQYSYQATDDYSYESFLNKCEDESNILLDGSDKVAAYFVPEKGRAYALLGLDEIKRGAKLYISIFVEGIRKVAEADRPKKLTDLITEEAYRVRENMVCSKQEKFWTDGAYRGIQLDSYSVKGLSLTQDLPEIDFHFEGESFSGKPFVYRIHGEQFEAYILGADQKTVKIEAEVNSYSYVYYNRDESEYTSVTLEDGSEWGVYVSNDKDGKPYYVYASRVLAGGERPVYFTYELSASYGSMVWADVNAFVEDLAALARNLSFEGIPAAE